MVIEVCGWRLEPNQSNGQRCWCLYHGRSTRAERFYDTLGRALRFVAEYALRFVAEYALRNDEDGVADVQEALDRYEAIVGRIERAVGGGA